MLRQITARLVSSVRALIFSIPWFHKLDAALVGRATDQSMKDLLVQLLSDLGFEEGVDFIVPPSNASCSDFLVTNDVANSVLQDILEGRVLVIRAYMREDGTSVRAHFRRVA